MHRQRGHILTSQLCTLCNIFITIWSTRTPTPDIKHAYLPAQQRQIANTPKYDSPTGGYKLIVRMQQQHDGTIPIRICRRYSHTLRFWCQWSSVSASKLASSPIPSIIPRRNENLRRTNRWSQLGRPNATPTWPHRKPWILHTNHWPLKILSNKLTNFNMNQTKTTTTWDSQTIGPKSTARHHHQNGETISTKNCTWYNNMLGILSNWNPIARAHAFKLA